MRFSPAAALAATLLASTTANAADAWDDKIKEYLRKGYLASVIAKTPDITLAYLCDPRGNYSWWAYKLNDPSLKRATLRVGGLTRFHTYDAQGQSHGQGVFFSLDPGPKTEGGPRPGDKVTPTPATATLSIDARSDSATRTIAVGAIPANVVAEIRRNCHARLPRALAPAVLVGRDAR